MPPAPSLAYYVSLGTIPNIIHTVTPSFYKAGSAPECPATKVGHLVFLFN